MDIIFSVPYKTKKWYRNEWEPTETIKARKISTGKTLKTQVSSGSLNWKEFVNLNSCLITITRRS
jgi:hypothetical protein